MKLQFNASLPHQQAAIGAVVDVFAGSQVAQSQFEVCGSSGAGMAFSEHGIGNRITLDDTQLLENVRAVQAQSDIEQATRLRGREFSVEMETGTGKTYVYLRTIFELAQRYGLKKFIIVVPSIAIREGVVKSVEMMRGHFRGIYANAPFNFFVYDSKKLGDVRQFAIGNEIQIMVLNIQAFSKDAAEAGADTTQLTAAQVKKLNVMNRENDKMSGYKPIDFLSSTAPIVIIDEPQSVDNTDKAKRAIARLKPAATLRYSATHRDAYNLLYKLDAIAAYDARLVKQIEVASVIAEEDFNHAYIKLLKTDNKHGIKAQVEIHKEHNGGIRAAKAWLKQGDALYAKSGQRACYREFRVHGISCKPGDEHIEFANGARIALGAATGTVGDDIMKAQVRTTIKEHLEKQNRYAPQGIKVLSLFFIDRVENYRVYHADGRTSLGKIGEWFEQIYAELIAEPKYAHLAHGEVSKIHDGYFSKDRTGKGKNTRGDTQDDRDTYALIMRDKERLLDLDNPLQFIFSHSALREGWDNPNVFQICTLNETRSAEKKRQEIGRGLRLPVDRHGQRIHEQSINRLTVVANESYDNFARALQQEFEEDCGIRFGVVAEIAFAKILRRVKDEQHAIGQTQSKQIFANLVKNGHLAADGRIVNVDSEDPDFHLGVGAEFTEIQPEIMQVIRSYMLQARIKNARQKTTVRLQKDMLRPDTEFYALWEKIKWRTRYQVRFDSEKIIRDSVARIEKLDPIRPARIALTHAELVLSKAGVGAAPVDSRDGGTIAVRVLPDILEYLQRETELTRHTLTQILKSCGRLNEFYANPQKFMSSVAREIKDALRHMFREDGGVVYKKVPGAYWQMERIAEDAEQEIVRYLGNLYQVQNREKSLFDHVEYDSQVEKRFAQALDRDRNVRLFVKLPRWFKINTPVGAYNPDWAFVTERDEKIYFVAETKGTLDKQKLRGVEEAKAEYGKRHFRELNVRYELATQLSDIRI